MQDAPARKEAQTFTFNVPQDTEPTRADKVLACHYLEFSRSLIQRAFEAGEVRLNGHVIKKKAHVRAGDTLLFSLIARHAAEVTPVALPLDILYEDEVLIGLNKASGQVVHPGRGTGPDTLVHALLHHCQGNLSLQSGAERPGVVHRLDKDTSGVILFAKTDEAYRRLSHLFASHKVHKEYLALVAKVPSLVSGSLRALIGRHPVLRTRMAVIEQGRAAHTDWQREIAFGTHCALLRCYPKTGRTHQIRVHLSHFGHPILGDKTYGYRVIQGLNGTPKRVLLHAQRLAFEHPITGEPLVLKAPLPDDFAQSLRQLREQFFG